MRPQDALADILQKVRDQHGDQYLFDDQPRYEVTLSGIEIERMLQAQSSTDVNRVPSDLMELLRLAPRDLPGIAERMTPDSAWVALCAMQHAVEHLAGVAAYIRARCQNNASGAEAERAAVKAVGEAFHLMTGRRCNGHHAAKFMKRSTGRHLATDQAEAA